MLLFSERELFFTSSVIYDREINISGDREMRRKVCFVICIVMVFTLLASCAKKEEKIEPKPEGRPLNTGKEDEMSGETVINTGLPEKSVYGVGILDRLYRSGENIVVSDLSINMALAMLAEGAKGETLAELEAYLGCPIDEYRAFVLRYLKELPDNEEMKVLISNSYWKDEACTIRDSYGKILEDNYKALFKEVDFSKEGTAAMINDFVKDKTKGLIDHLVDDGDIYDLKMMIMNCLYFKGLWGDEVNIVKEEDFKGLKNTKKTKMLFTSEDTYFENEKAVAFSKKYMGRYEFIGILPKEEGDFSLQDLDISSLLKSRNDSDYKVHTMIPELDIKFGSDITTALEEMGIKHVFAPELADLGNMSDESLYADTVIHKTRLKLNKEGTEAAAVTAIMVKATGLPMMEKRTEVDIHLDRPFAFLIYDTENDIALFTGKVMMP